MRGASPLNIIAPSLAPLQSCNIVGKVCSGLRGGLHGVRSSIQFLLLGNWGPALKHSPKSGAASFHTPLQPVLLTRVVDTMVRGLGLLYNG